MIDALSFLGHYPFRKLRVEKLDEVVNKYIKLGFKAIALMKLESLFYRNSRVANRELLRDLEIVKDRGVNVYPLASLNPEYFVNVKDVVEECCESGFKAIVISPPYHGFKLRSRKAVNFAIQVLDYGLSLIVLNLIEDVREMNRAYKFRYRLTMSEVSDFLNEVNKRVKEVKILLSNFTARELKELRSKYRGEVFVDIAHQYVLGPPIDDVELLVELYGEERVLLSTCFPMKYIHPTIYKVIYSKVDEGVKMKILELNARKFYRG